MTNFERAPLRRSRRRPRHALVGPRRAAPAGAPPRRPARRPTGRRRSTSRSRPSTTRTTSTASCSRRSSHDALDARAGGIVDRRDAGALLVARGVRARRVAALGPPRRRRHRRAAHRRAPRPPARRAPDGPRARAAAPRSSPAAPRGVGRATADLLAAEGCRVAVLARTPQDLRETEEELARRGRRRRHRPRVRPARHRRGRGRVHVPRRALGRVPRAREHRRPRARRRPRRPHRRRLARRVRPRRAHDGPHHARRAPAAAQGDVRPHRERRRVVDPSPEPGPHRLHRGQGGDGERVEEPVPRAGARGHHREHRRAGHGDVAHARGVPGRHRPRGPARGSARGRLRGHRARLRRVERHRPRRPARGGRGRGRVPLLGALRASSWAPPSRSTAAPTSSESPRGDCLRAMEFNLADLWEAVADAIPDREALVCGDRRLTYARGRRARHPPRPPPRRRTASAPATTSRSTSTTAPSTSRACSPRSSCAPSRQRELPLRRGRAAVPARRRRRPRRRVPPRVRAEARRHPRRPAAARALRRGRRRRRRSGRGRRPRRRCGVDVRGRAGGRVAGTRLRSPLRRRPLHPLHRRHHRHAEGRDVAGRGHLLRRARRRRTSAASRSPRPSRSSANLDAKRRCLPACPFMHGTAHWLAFDTLYSAAARS